MAKADRYEVIPSRAASQFHQLPMVVRDIVRLCDGRRTLEAICAASPLGGGDTVEVLRRLSALGVVVVRSRPRVRRAPPAPAPDPAAVAHDFSADEERFFASSIDHLIED